MTLCRVQVVSRVIDVRSPDLSLWVPFIDEGVLMAEVALSELCTSLESLMYFLLEHPLVVILIQWSWVVYMSTITL